MTPLQTRIVNDTARIEPTEEVSKNHPFRPKEEVSRVLGKGVTELIIDLGPLPFIDSVGLGELVSSHAACVKAKAKLRLVRPTGSVWDVLRSAGLDRILNIERG